MDCRGWVVAVVAIRAWLLAHTRAAPLHVPHYGLVVPVAPVWLQHICPTVHWLPSWFCRIAGLQFAVPLQVAVLVPAPGQDYGWLRLYSSCALVLAHIAVGRSRVLQLFVRARVVTVVTLLRLL